MCFFKKKIRLQRGDIVKHIAHYGPPWVRVVDLNTCIHGRVTKIFYDKNSKMRTAQIDFGENVGRLKVPLWRISVTRYGWTYNPHSDPANEHNWDL